MTEKINQSSLKNAKFENMTAEQVIKKYEEVLNSREKQIYELSAEVGQITKKTQKMKAKYENCKEQNIKLKNIFQKKEVLLKQELDNKELMFMQLTKKEKECDEIQKKIDDLKKNKQSTKNENVTNRENNEINNDTKNNNENKKENDNKEEEKKDLMKEKDKEKDNPDVKSLAKEKINQLTHKGEGMKKINFAELLKKNKSEKND